MKKVCVIGSGFSGLAASACLAKAGFAVTVLEKNAELGGRARKFEDQGFTFDMGPSWYWMPEVFEQFFNLFDKSASEFYTLVRLNPSYEVIFGKNDKIALPADFEELKKVFEEMETGSASKLETFLADAEYKYKVGMNEFVWKPGHTVMEFADLRVFKSLFRLQMLSSISGQIDSLFKNEKIRNILKFPVLFLGATPQDTPALYSLMNYADIKLGTWYPMGGMFKVIDAFVEVAKNQGVTFITNAEVRHISVKDNKAHTIHTDSYDYTFDYVVASADYHHVDKNLLPPQYSNYTTSYWEKRKMAPSSLIFYIGLDIKLDKINHHNLFFDRDFASHAHQIYTQPSWPSDPLFYMCVPSVTDSTVAPVGKENVFFLLPIAPGIHDNEIVREKYFKVICDRLKETIDIDIMPHIIFKRSYCVDNFISDYNSYKGNAYGLANTLRQTAFLKPKLQNKKLSNLYYTGQLTTPGPGVPPSIISGQVVASEIIKHSKN